MPGNFECVGIRVGSPEDLEALVRQILDDAQLIADGRKTDAYRWQDDSGARLVIESRDGLISNVLPSFASDTQVPLADVVRLNDDTSAADVVDSGGQTATRLAVDLEQRVAIVGSKVRGTAGLVGLVGDASIHADADEFTSSPRSLLIESDEEPGPPPPHFVEQGWPWPPRMGSESFVSMGLFGEPRDARPIARLNGVVLEADLRTNSLTGLTFIRTRVRTAGFDADICAPESELDALPQPGEVFSGTVYMVGSLHDWVADVPEKSGWRSRLFGGRASN